MSALPVCNDEVYRNGAVVFVTHSIPSAKLEGWVRSVAQKSRQPVDWHFIAGRAVIKALGDQEAVKQAIRELLPEHDRLFEEELERMRTALGGAVVKPPRPAWL